MQVVELRGIIDKTMMKVGILVAENLVPESLFRTAVIDTHEQIIPSNSRSISMIQDCSPRMLDGVTRKADAKNNATNQGQRGKNAFRYRSVNELLGLPSIATTVKDQDSSTGKVWWQCSCCLRPREERFDLSLLHNTKPSSKSSQHSVSIYYEADCLTALNIWHSAWSLKKRSACVASQWTC